MIRNSEYFQNCLKHFSWEKSSAQIAQFVKCIDWML